MLYEPAALSPADVVATEASRERRERGRWCMLYEPAPAPTPADVLAEAKLRKNQYACGVCSCGANVARRLRSPALLAVPTDTCS
jgi:hypothetical protein